MPDVAVAAVDDETAADAIEKIEYEAIGDDFLRRTPATPSMIVAAIDAGKRVDEGLVTHV